MRRKKYILRQTVIFFRQSQIREGCDPKIVREPWAAARTTIAREPRRGENDDCHRAMAVVFLPAEDDGVFGRNKNARGPDYRNWRGFQDRQDDRKTVQASGTTEAAGLLFNNSFAILML